jgi:hypothetical protein
MLTAQTRRLPKQPGMDANMAAVSSTGAQPAEVRTYGIGDPDAPDADDDMYSQDF